MPALLVASVTEERFAVEAPAVHLLFSFEIAHPNGAGACRTCTFTSGSSFHVDPGQSGKKVILPVLMTLILPK